MKIEDVQIVRDPEPRWPAVVALLGAGGLTLFIPNHFTLGPKWLPLLVSTAFAIPAVIASAQHRYKLANVFGHAVSAVLSLSLTLNVSLVVYNLTQKPEPAIQLLEAAGAMWVINILVFASWYWRIDGGGPHARDLRNTHEEGAFLFPQMTMDWETRRRTGQDNWSPGFVDYLFLSFCTSTALSPADTGALTRWAKGLIMAQSTLSLSIVVLLAARAINTL